MINKYLSSKTDTIRSLDGPLKTNYFAGSFYEILPLLLKESARSGHPAALIGDRPSQFALVEKDVKNELCQKGKHPYSATFTYRSAFFEETTDVIHRHSLEVMTICY